MNIVRKKFENLIMIFLYLVLFLVPIYFSYSFNEFFSSREFFFSKEIFLSFGYISMCIISLFLLFSVISLYFEGLSKLITEKNLHLFENLSIGFITASIFILLVEKDIFLGILGIVISFVLLGGIYYIKK